MLAFVPALPCNKWPSPARARAKCGGTMARRFCRGGGDGFTVIDCCWSHVKSCVLLKIPKNITPLSCIIRLNSLPPRSLHFWPHNPQFLSLYAPSWPPQKLQKSSTTPPNLQRFAPKLSNNTVFAELQIPDKSTGKHQRHKNCG